MYLFYHLMKKLWKGVSMVIRWIRKYTGVIVSVVGFILLIILTFGDLGELFTEEYWRNVGGNITSIFRGLQLD